MHKLKHDGVFALVFLLLFIIFIANAPAGFTAGDDDSRTKEFFTIKLSAMGNKTDIHVVKDKEGTIYFPINSLETAELFNQFKCQATYLVPMDTIVLTLPKFGDTRFSLKDRVAYVGIKKIDMKKSPMLVDDKPYIPLEALEIAMRVKINYNDQNRTYFMEPVISSISLNEEKGKLKFDINSSGPVKYNTSILENPLRYAIDIEGASLAEFPENKDVYNQIVGKITISQVGKNPGRVQVIIPMDKGVEIEMGKDSKDPNVLSGWILSPQVAGPVQDLKQERVTDFLIKEDKDRVVFTVKTTGPVQYEWRRLLPPDNRYIIDIPKTLYTAAEINKTFDSKYIKSVKVSQHRTIPEPIVRVAIDLNSPSNVTVSPNPKYPQEIQIQVLESQVNPQAVERRGYGVTDYAVRSGIVICIDPGHGGGDPGACNDGYGLMEKELTLDISMRLAALLKRAGWNVVMTRTTDRDVSYAGSSDSRELGDRVNIANQTRASLFVSIHINASEGSGACGTSVHFCKPDSEFLAQNILNSILSSNGRPSAGVQNDGFYVVRNTVMPAVLVECAFISNPSEATLLASPDFRQKCANGIYNGLMAYARAKNIGVAQNNVLNADVLRVVEQKQAELDRKIQNSKGVNTYEYTER